MAFNLKTLWKEYCQQSSVHGLRYTVDTKTGIVQRLTWATIMSIAALFVLYRLLVSWETFSTGDIQITVENPRYPLYAIEFPAVTICPVNKVMYSKIKNLMEREGLNILDEETVQSFTNSMLVFSLLRYPFYNHGLEYVQQSRRRLYPIKNKDIHRLMRMIKPTVDDVFYKCFWRGTQYDCKRLLRLQRTEEGYCYSFNSNTAERITYSETNKTMVPPFYSREKGSLTPLRNNAAGKLTGFEFMLNSLDHEYLPGDGRMRAYNVMVHSPRDLPDVSADYIVYPRPRKLFRISVSVTSIIIDESVASVHPQKRLCHLSEKGSHDSSVLNWNTWSGENMCYTQCRLKAIYETCNCVPYFFHPFRLMTGDFEQCGINHIECLALVNVQLRNYQTPAEKDGFPSWSVPMYMNCSCQQPCTFMSYSSEIKEAVSDLWQRENYSMHVDVTYKDLYATRYKRSAKYTMQDLLVSLGGVASLFLGCSILSVVELLYYITRTVLYFKETKIRKMHEIKNVKVTSTQPCDQKHDVIFVTEPKAISHQNYPLSLPYLPHTLLERLKKSQILLIKVYNSE